MGELYNRISALCIQKGVTPYRMCKEIGIQGSIVSDLKSGRKKTINIETATKIADFFDVSADYLLGRTDDANPSELILPEELRDVRVAFHGGTDDLTQEEVDKVAEYVRFIRSQRKKED